MWGKEGGKCLPYRQLIVFCIININRVNVEITPSFLGPSSLFSCAQNPFPFPFKCLLQRRITPEWNSGTRQETDKVITSTQQHTPILELDCDFLFSRVICIFFWIKVKCKLSGCNETLLLHISYFAYFGLCCMVCYVVNTVISSIVNIT